MKALNDKLKVFKFDLKLLNFESKFQKVGWFFFQKLSWKVLKSMLKFSNSSKKFTRFFEFEFVDEYFKINFVDEVGLQFELVV